jgi:threonine dehydrogenase-like Zn-dependent dehydrogenase
MHYKYPFADKFKDLPRPDFHAHSGNLILYGAGVNGLIAAVLLQKMGVEYICFADSDKRKWDTEYMGKPVISPHELKERYPDAAIMVTPYHLRPVYKQLREMGYKTLFDCLHLFLEFDTEDIEPLLPKQRYLPGQFPIAINNYLRKLSEFHVYGLGGNRGLTIFVTERCTLRCKHCINFIPYYTSPKDCDFNTLSTALNLLFNTGRFAYVNIEGGEIFLYKHLAKLVDILASFPDVEQIFPITNATILPDSGMLNSFHNKKVIVRISNYNENSYKFLELTKLFDRNDISYNATLQQWSRFDVKQFNRSEEENQKLFENCCKSDGNPNLVHGKLYRCAFAPHLENLGVLPHSPQDCVDLTATAYDEVDLCKKVDELYAREKFIQACCYCEGRTYAGEKIPIAEQAVGKLPPLPNFCK